MVMKLFVFGNEYLEDDSMARRVAVHLNNVELVHCRSPEQLFGEENINILDVVKGVDKPIIITNISQLKTRNILSLHDFDLGFFLNLLKEMGQEPKIKIFGLPDKGDPIGFASWVSNQIS